MNFCFDYIEIIILNKMSLSKKNKNKHWQEYGKIGILTYCRWNLKMVQPVWKTVWPFLKRLQYGVTIWYIVYNFITRYIPLK